MEGMAIMEESYRDDALEFASSYKACTPANTAASSLGWAPSSSSWVAAA